MNHFTYEEVLEEFEEAQWPTWRVERLWRWVARQMERVRAEFRAKVDRDILTRRLCRKRPVTFTPIVTYEQKACDKCGGIIELRPRVGGGNNARGDPTMFPVHIGRCSRE